MHEDVRRTLDGFDTETLANRALGPSWLLSLSPFKNGKGGVHEPKQLHNRFP